MKKVISVLFAIILLSNMCVFGSSANASGENIYQIGNKTIIFNESSAFSIEEQQTIVTQLVSPEQEHSTYGLMCTLFGHKNTTEAVQTITHRVDTKAPRCLLENFEITTCSRCGETTTERISYYYISCCPED
ncbi:MAG: hypothetical protein IJX28_06385 [Clostridia bacterium]|nr:hypothetical protein [Clostridia bacterium]